MGFEWDFIGIQWDFIVIQWDIDGIHPLLIVNVASSCELEHGHFGQKVR